MKRKLDVLKRVYLLFLGFLVVAVILFARVIKINVVEGDRWRSAGDSLYIKNIPLEAQRGNILSDDGSFLATSLQFFDIRVDLNSSAMRDTAFDNNIDALSQKLARHVNPNWSATRYKNYLISERKKGNRYLLIKRKATFGEVEKIKKFPLFNQGLYKGGLILEPRVERVKPFQSLANRTIGQNRKNAPKVGIEASFDKYLKGIEGHRTVQKVNNVYIPLGDLMDVKPVKGLDVQTTIDVGVQDVAHSSLLRALEHHQAEFGVAIVMEVETGAIKALVNLRKTKGGGYAEIFNDAIGTPVEPGSTIKLATMMALMEDKLIKLDDRVDVNYGKNKFCGLWMHDSEYHKTKTMSVSNAFIHSSNVGMARLVMDHYQKHDNEQNFVNRLRQFKLGEKTGINIKGEGMPYIKDANDKKERWSCTSLPWMSTGYEMTMTPLQLLSFYNAVANDGRYMKPYVVSHIYKDRAIVEEFKPTYYRDRIASKSTIKKAKKLLEEVMLDGTGSDIKLPFPTAGKTGTAVTNYSDKNRDKKIYQASFSGYFPADNPKYSCMVLVKGPTKNGYYASKVAGPAFREIALKCMNRIPEYVDHYEGSKTNFPVMQVGDKDDLEVILSHCGIHYKTYTETDFAILDADKDTIELKSRRIPTEKTPNVVNMGLKDALYVLENKGYQASVIGVGRVKKQHPLAYTKREDDHISLVLE